MDSATSQDLNNISEFIFTISLKKKCKNLIGCNCFSISIDKKKS